ncbi:hypothetical protein D3C85_1075380 [compost metagenome]
MNNSQAFKKAHAMTKAIIANGDNYSVTFGQCLKLVKAEAIEQAKAVDIKERTAQNIEAVMSFSKMSILVVGCVVVLLMLFVPMIGGITGVLQHGEQVAAFTTGMVSCCALILVGLFVSVVGWVAETANDMLPA